MEQAIRSDTDAFAKLYDSYVDRVYRFVYFRVGNVQMAEDLSSQVFLKAWENLGQYEIRGLSFGAWLFRIARNLVIDHYRTKKDHESLEEDGSFELHPALMVDGKIDAEFEAEWLRSAMMHLTDDQRTVLTLKSIEGLSTAEIAKVMGKRQGAVRALQLRGLRALAEIIEHPKRQERPPIARRPPRRQRRPGRIVHRRLHVSLGHLPPRHHAPGRVPHRPSQQPHAE